MRKNEMLTLPLSSPRAVLADLLQASPDNCRVVVLQLRDIRLFGPRRWRSVG